MKRKVRGDEIRRRRMEKFLTQQELADRAGVSSQTVSSLESGTEGAWPKTLLAIAGALGCEPEDISELVAEATA